MALINIHDFINKSRLFNKLEVDELLFVEYHCIGEEERMSYWTDNNCFVYIVKGKKKWETIHGTYYVKAGEAIFIRKGACSVNQYFDEDLCALLIFVPDEFIKNVICNHTITPATDKPFVKPDNLIPVKVDDNLSAYFLSVYNYFTESVKPPKDLLKLKFTELIINIMMNPRNITLASYFSDICRDNAIPIEEVMNQNFAYNLRLEEFARLSARSLSTFKRDFLRHYKMSPGKWLTQKRLDYARFMLENTGKSIRQVVFDCGFENVSHFTKIFKNKYGEPPQKYRSKMSRNRIA